MTVYVVTSGEYSDYTIEAIFSAPEKAARYAGKRGCQIEPFDVDVPEDDSRSDEAGRKAGEPGLHIVKINTFDGQIALNPDPGYIEGATAEGPGHCLVRIWPWRTREDVAEITVASPVSLEHAVKVAVERRQEWLRTKSPTP